MNILDRVSCKLSDEDLINLILSYKNDDISIHNSVYEYFRNDVSDIDKKECAGYKDFFVEYFNKNTDKIWYCNTSPYSRYNGNLTNKEEEYSSIEQIVSSSKYNNLFCKPIFFQGKDIESRTICVDGSYGKGIKEKYDCRLYMCPKMENIIPIIKKLITIHNNLNINCYLKFNIDSNNNDRITLYSSLENVDKHLQIIKKLQNDNPELFESMGKNKLWGSIDDVDNVYFGMNPYLFNHGCSYLAVRSMILEEALIDLKNKFPELSSAYRVTNEMLDYFKEMIRLYSITHNVNPDNFCININNSSRKKRKSPITLERSSGDLPIVVDYLLPESKKAIISSPFYAKDNNNYLIIDVDDLDKLYCNDDYSQEYKKYILKKVEFLHTKSKICSGFKLLRHKHASILSVETDTDYICHDGQVSYGLYKAVPTKISNYMCLLTARNEQHLKGTIDIEVIEKLSSKIDEVFDINSKELDNSKKIIDGIIKEQKEKSKKENEQKRLVLSRKNNSLL